ncbi:MAG: DUF4349 domain-containing protein [Saprospiraceae bacterium]|nr:DUF4349 domain-containing protein [Saprospiraceae bacterium]
MAHSSSISPLRIFGLCALFFLSACQQKSEAPFSDRGASAPPPQGMENQAKLDRAPMASATPEQFQDAANHGDIFSSAAAVPSAIDSLKKFVRTAQMRFRVKNSADATLRIEDIALSNGGFVINSNLNSELELRQTTPISRDSALETTRYSIHSQLVIRVPYQMLDTTLRSIGRLSDFLDLRHVNASDVGLQMLEQELSKLREGIYRNDLDQAEENKISPKADRARASRAASDHARIETLKLEDAIRFSTITVDVYQVPEIRQMMVTNTDVPIPQRPLAARLGEALRSGGEILLVMLLGMVHLWSLILLAVLGYFTWKWLRKRKRLVIADVQKSS